MLLSAPPDLVIEPLVRAALAEDLAGGGDITSEACIAADARMTAVFAARRTGVIAGLACARIAVGLTDPAVRFKVLVADGETVAAGAVIARVEANARALLAAERTALNLLGRLSGVATLTAAFVAEVAPTKARIVDTRKTTPCLRALEKYAVRCGGGGNHRFGLGDVLIKYNHLAACGGVRLALERARARAGHMARIEIEVDSLAALREALECEADAVLLDNFTVADLERAVALTAGRAVLEASGGVDLTTVAAIAATGVDIISVGALTHSAPVLDIGLDVAARKRTD
jgi:nicotinate-nucleotide pyrophosphorylase (carboxylating)